jgi:zinc transporter ZupT
MTNAQSALTTKINALSPAALKACAMDAGATATDEATIVLDYCLARLAGCMTSAEFIAFCEALPEADFHAAN